MTSGRQRSPEPTPGRPRSHDSTTGRQRPRDRRAQILATASARFYRYGFHNVGMADIAAAVGITPGALYRHFRGKEDLLLAVVTEGLEHIAIPDLRQADKLRPDEVDSFLAAITQVSLDRREIGVLWQRESRHLPPEAREGLRVLMRRRAESVAVAVRALRPELADDDVSIIAWAVMAMYASPAHHRTRIERAEYERILVRVGTTILWTRAVPSPETSGATILPRRRWEPARFSRREMLLAAAIRLFHAHGYRAVSMTDIGAAVGITGASVYNHFATKHELLVAALRRANETLQSGLSRVLADARTPGEALGLVLRSYVDTTLGHPDVMGAVVTEVVNLPEPERGSIRQHQRDYIAEWLQLVVAAGPPDLDETEARVLVHTILAIISAVARTGSLRTGPNLAPILVALCEEILEQAGVKTGQPDVSAVPSRSSERIGGS